MNIPSSVLASVHARFPYNSDLLHKALGILERDELRSAASGNFVCKSKTKERVEYVISADGAKCGCLAGQHELFCSHRLALYIQQEMLAQTKANVVATGKPQLDVISLREQKAKDNRAARTEWEEML